MGMFDSAIARLSGRTDLEKQREKERQRQRQVQERQLEERKRKQEQDWRQEARGGNGGAARFAPPKLTRTPSGRETAGRVALHGTGAKEAPALPWGAGAPRGVHTLAELHQRDAEQCAGCKLLIWEDSRHLTAMDKAWHVGCFKCGACRLALTGSYIPKDGQPYHAGCYKEQFHPHCSVCASYLPEDEDGCIVSCISEHWPDEFCPKHRADGTPRCCSCYRLRPRSDGAWVELGDGRQICSPCSATMATTSADAGPLYADVLGFFRILGMALPSEPPVMLVSRSVMQDAHKGEPPRRLTDSVYDHEHDALGLCSSQTWQSVQTVTRLERKPVRRISFRAVEEQVPVGPKRCEITSIFVVYGLPALSTGEVLAHECMHAFLRLTGSTELSRKVEEGLCQLMALLWLERQEAKGIRGAHEKELCTLYLTTIHTWDDEIYGEGFRDAYDAYRAHGLRRVLQHVRRYNRLP